MSSPLIQRWALAVAFLSMSALSSGAPIVIDDFTANQGTFSGGSSATGYGLNLYADVYSGSFGGFNRRSVQSTYTVYPTNNVVFSGSAIAVGNGSMTLRHAKGGPPLLTGTGADSRTYLVYDASGSRVDLTDGGSNNAMRLSFSGVTITGLSPVFTIRVDGFSLLQYSGPLIPTTTVSGTTVDIPFSSFGDPFDFSSVDRITMWFQNEGAATSGQARSAQYTFTGVSIVSVVPEPSTYAMSLAGLGFTGYSMFRRRKRA